MKPGDPSTIQTQPPGAADAPMVRVIAVGRTELEPALRRMPGAELVRARTGLDAIGELASPASHDTASVVVVGRDAHALAADGGGDDASLAAALRRVDPNVRILAAGDRDCDDSIFDGAVNAADPPGSLLRALFATSPPPLGSFPDAGAIPAACSVAEAKPIADAEPVHPAEGDEALVRALLRGDDVIPAAMRLIAQRLPGVAASFVEAKAGAPEPPHACPVDWRGASLGWLTFEAAPPPGAPAQARWLGAWLTLREQHAQLSQAAFTDPLTGAWSRRYFDRFLAAAIEQARPQRGTVTVLFFDIDDFKRFNDDHGHAAGDEILRETVALLRSVIRPEDKVCRIGGDEFAVIFHLPEGPRDPASKPPESVCAIAQRFQNQVRLRRFPKLGLDAPGTLTISGGLATYPWDGRTPEELLRRADELAIQCKRQGKNAIIFGPGAAGV